MDKWGQYKVEFCRDRDGKTVYDYDVYFGRSATSAVEDARAEYGELPGFKILHVYFGRDQFWEPDESWQDW